MASPAENLVAAKAAYNQQFKLVADLERRLRSVPATRANAPARKSLEASLVQARAELERRRARLVQANALAKKAYSKPSPFRPGGTRRPIPMRDVKPGPIRPLPGETAAQFQERANGLRVVRKGIRTQQEKALAHSAPSIQAATTAYAQEGGVVRRGQVPLPNFPPSAPLTLDLVYSAEREDTVPVEQQQELYAFQQERQAELRAQGSPEQAEEASNVLRSGNAAPTAEDSDTNSMIRWGLVAAGLIGLGWYYYQHKKETDETEEEEIAPDAGEEA